MVAAKTSTTTNAKRNVFNYGGKRLSTSANTLNAKAILEAAGMAQPGASTLSIPTIPTKIKARKRYR
jgi:hypothetical protein